MGVLFFAFFWWVNGCPFFFINRKTRKGHPLFINRKEPEKTRKETRKWNQKRTPTFMVGKLMGVLFFAFFLMSKWVSFFFLSFFFLSFFFLFFLFFFLLRASVWILPRHLAFKTHASRDSWFCHNMMSGARQCESGQYSGHYWDHKGTFRHKNVQCYLYLCWLRRCPLSWRAWQ